MSANHSWNFDSWTAAQKTYLSTYLVPRLTNTIVSFEGEIIAPEEWTDRIGMSPEVCTRRFVQAKLLTSAQLQFQLNYKFKPEELRLFVVKRGGIASDRVHDLIYEILRLYSKAELWSIIPEPHALELTPMGKRIVHAHLEAIQAAPEHEKAKVSGVPRKMLITVLNYIYHAVATGVIGSSAFEALRYLGVAASQASTTNAASAASQILVVPISSGPPGQVQPNNPIVATIMGASLIFWGIAAWFRRWRKKR